MTTKTSKKIKYPSTLHLPWSQGLQNADRKIEHLHGFLGEEVVVTEKLDGENTSLYCDDLHARSLDTRPHPSRNWLKAERGRIAHQIPRGWRLCGENVYAVHSLRYHELESYFYLFSVWNEQNISLPWDEVLKWSKILCFPTPPELYRGTWNQQLIEALEVDTQKMEGYVVRVVDAIPYTDFGRKVAKWVRHKHVQTDQHWLNKPVEVNELKKDQYEPHDQ